MLLWRFTTTGRRKTQACCGGGVVIFESCVPAVFRSGLCVPLYRCVVVSPLGSRYSKAPIAKPAQCFRFMPSSFPPLRFVRLSVPVTPHSLHAGSGNNTLIRHARLQYRAALRCVFARSKVTEPSTDARALVYEARPAPFKSLDTPTPF